MRRATKYIVLGALTAPALLFGVGFASWQFIESASSEAIKPVGVTTWSFNDKLPMNEDETMSVNDKGQLVIKDENGAVVAVIDADNWDFDYGSGSAPSTGGGNVSMGLGVEDGKLVVNEYTASNIGNTLFADANLTFPKSIVIEGEEYDIKGITSPITLGARGAYAIFEKDISLTVPEGYERICDDAFSDMSNISYASNLNIIYNLPSTLEYLGHHAFNFSTSATLKINYSGSVAQWKDLIANSASKYGSGYSFYSGTTSTVTIYCANNQTVKYQNGIGQ